MNSTTTELFSDHDLSFFFIRLTAFGIDLNLKNEKKIIEKYSEICLRKILEICIATFE